MLVELTSSKNWTKVAIEGTSVVNVVSNPLGSEIQFLAGTSLLKVEVTESVDQVMRKVNGPAEDQYSVCAWRDETFGKSEDPGKLLARCGEEFMELMELVVPESAGPAMAVVLDAWRATASSKGVDPALVADEMADVVIFLYGVSHGLGVDLHHAVDEKMKVNRAREWTTKGDGLGQHA